MRSGVMRMRVSRLRPWRMISWPAAKGMRWVKPSIAMMSPSRKCSSTASASESMAAMQFPRFPPENPNALNSLKFPIPGGGPAAFLHCRFSSMAGPRRASGAEWNNSRIPKPVQGLKFFFRDRELFRMLAIGLFGPRPFHWGYLQNRWVIPPRRLKAITERQVMHQPLFQLPPTDPAEQPDFVTALARGLAVIRAFGTQPKRMSLAEIARQVNLPRATVRRSLITLETLGYVESDGKTFMLTPQVLSLGHSYLASMPVTRAVQPRLERMSAQFNEVSSAGILDHDDTVFLARVPVRRVSRERMPTGGRMPAYCTSLGRVLLAAQPDAMIDEYL